MLMPRVSFNFSLKSVVANEWAFALGLKTNWDLHVFIHDPGDEIWLAYMNFVFDMMHFKLDAHNSDGMRATDITLKVNENHFRSSLRAPCKSYSKVKWNIILPPNSSIVLCVC